MAEYLLRWSRTSCEPWSKDGLGAIATYSLVCLFWAQTPNAEGFLGWILEGGTKQTSGQGVGQDIGRD
jgi:hypothetical protein